MPKPWKSCCYRYSPTRFEDGWCWPAKRYDYYLKRQCVRVPHGFAFTDLDFLVEMTCDSSFSSGRSRRKVCLILFNWVGLLKSLFELPVFITIQGLSFWTIRWRPSIDRNYQLPPLPLWLNPISTVKQCIFTEPNQHRWISVLHPASELQPGSWRLLRNQYELKSLASSWWEFTGCLNVKLGGGWWGSPSGQELLGTSIQCYFWPPASTCWAQFANGLATAIPDQHLEMAGLFFQVLNHLAQWFWYLWLNPYTRWSETSCSCCFENIRSAVDQFFLKCSRYGFPTDGYFWKWGMRRTNIFLPYIYI